MRLYLSLRTLFYKGTLSKTIDAFSLLHVQFSHCYYAINSTRMHSGRLSVWLACSAHNPNIWRANAAVEKWYSVSMRREESYTTMIKGLVWVTLLELYSAVFQEEPGPSHRPVDTTEGDVSPLEVMEAFVEGWVQALDHEDKKSTETNAAALTAIR